MDDEEKKTQRGGSARRTARSGEYPDGAHTHPQDVQEPLLRRIPGRTEGRSSRRRDPTSDGVSSLEVCTRARTLGPKGWVPVHHHRGSSATPDLRVHGHSMETLATTGPGHGTVAQGVQECSSGDVGGESRRLGRPLFCTSAPTARRHRDGTPGPPTRSRDVNHGSRGALVGA